MSRKFASLDSLRKEEAEKEGNEYYAGGNDARGGGSGLAVEGQPEHVRKLMSQASAAGAVDRPAGQQVTKVTVYKNGFTIDDGEFRDLSEEKNRKFMDTLMEGHIPPELNHCVVDGRAHMDLENRGDIDFVPPHVPYVAFGGAAAVVGGPAMNEGAAINPDVVASAPLPVVDNNAPFSTLQIRTHDGKKLRINGGAPPSAFTLSFGFPPQIITSLGKTIEETGLSGASVTIKLL